MAQNHWIKMIQEYMSIVVKGYDKMTLLVVKVNQLKAELSRLHCAEDLDERKR